MGKKLIKEMQMVADAMKQFQAMAAEQEARNRSIFSSSFPELQKMMAGGGGISDDELAKMNSLFIQGLPEQYANLFSGLKTQMSRRGALSGQRPVGSDYLRAFGTLGADQAKTTAEGLLRNILMQGESKRNERQFALNLAQGLRENSAGTLGGVFEGANTNMNLSLARKQMGGGFWKSLGSSLFGAVLNPIGAGLGKALSSKIKF